MKHNVGKADKMIRIFLGVAIIGAGVYFKSWFGLIGIVPLLTAIVGFCPLYTLLGISTCKVAPKSAENPKKGKAVKTKK